MLSTLTDINPQDVLFYARQQGMMVETLEDFRDQSANYEMIEDIMKDYQLSHAQWSSLGGLTTGMGGVSTSIALASLDAASLAIQLYRLAHQFAVLNGFNAKDPVQKDQILTIYFDALGIDGAARARLKDQFLKARAVAGSRQVSDNFMLKLIIKVGKLLAERLSTRGAGRMVPILGGVVGASVNYTFAKKTSKTMKQAFRRVYFDTWVEG
jgi:hypothetical protein